MTSDLQNTGWIAAICRLLQRILARKSTSRKSKQGSSIYPLR